MQNSVLYVQAAPINNSSDHNNDDSLQEREHTYSNKCYYKGQWKANRRHGQGEFRWPSGVVYNGTYDRDLRTGRGMITYKDQSTYNGNWKNDKKEG